MVFQKEIILSPYSRGFHLITSKIINHIPKVSGIAHLFIKHTSASLTINENADPSVRDDFETHFNHMVSENENYFTHMRHSLSYSVKFIWLAFMTLVHAFFPFIFTNASSKLVKKINDHLDDRLTKSNQ